MKKYFFVVFEELHHGDVKEHDLEPYLHLVLTLFYLTVSTAIAIILDIQKENSENKATQTMTDSINAYKKSTALANYRMGFLCHGNYLNTKSFVIKNDKKNLLQKLI